MMPWDSSPRLGWALSGAKVALIDGNAMRWRHATTSPPASSPAASACALWVW